MTDIPPQFDHPPTIQVIEKRMTSAEIIAVCNKGPNVLACSSVPLYYDSTNDQLYIYRGGWKQPKTPAGAAVVNWQ